MTKKNNQLLMLLSAVGLMAFTACTNDKYDLGDIDTTIGVGSDEGLTLPTSSTKEIFLDDFLELSSNESVVFDADSNYVFLQEGNIVEPTEVIINEIPIRDTASVENPFTIDIPNLPVDLSPFIGQKLEGTRGSKDEETIYTMFYVGDKPQEIDELNEVNTDGTFKVHIGFPENIASFIPSFTTFKLEFPSFMEIELLPEHTDKYVIKDNILSTKNGSVSTKDDLDIGISIKKLLIGDNGLIIDGDKIFLEGDIKMTIAWEDITVGASKLYTSFTNNLQISDLVITGATGRFNPDIEMPDLGTISVEELPDFLTDENVVLDLYNPQIIIHLESQLTVPGFLSGALIAKDKNGNTLLNVDIPDLNIDATDDNTKKAISNIMLCRHGGDFEKDPEYTHVVEVEGLKDFIEQLPYTSTIEFKTKAYADTTKTCSIQLGHPHEIDPSYLIKAPLAFGQDARIVYKDTLDGWNDDVKDLEFADGAYVEVTAEIENRIPAYLTLEAYAIDVNGEEIKDLKMEVTSDIKAATLDGSGNLVQTTSPIRVMIEHEKDKGDALQRVDGIIFTFTAAASDSNPGSGNRPVEGITLNGKNHSLLAKDIKVTVKGKLIIKNDD